MIKENQEAKYSETSKKSFHSTGLFLSRTIAIYLISCYRLFNSL